MLSKSTSRWLEHIEHIYNCVERVTSHAKAAVPLLQARVIRKTAMAAVFFAINEARFE